MTRPRVGLQLPVGILGRAASLDDAAMLAELMLDAYRNTIDYEGESITEAISEVDSYFSRSSMDPTVASHSLVLVFHDTIVCACLLEFWQKRSVPFVSFVMSRSTHKRQGLATFALQEAIDRLQQAGWAELRTIITENNAASEALFANAGFRRVD